MFGGERQVVAGIQEHIDGCRQGTTPSVTQPTMSFKLPLRFSTAYLMLPSTSVPSHCPPRG